MSRYIDADALMERFAEMQKVKPDKDGLEYACNFRNMGGEPSAEWFTVEDAVENAQTVDAVSVVRCKDCVKRPPATARNGDKPTSDCPLWCGYCFGIDDNYGGEFYCEKGVRKADGKLNG